MHECGPRNGEPDHRLAVATLYLRKVKSLAMIVTAAPKPH